MKNSLGQKCRISFRLWIMAWHSWKMKKSVMLQSLIYFWNNSPILYKPSTTDTEKYGLRVQTAVYLLQDLCSTWLYLRIDRQCEKWLKAICNLYWKQTGTDIFFNISSNTLLRRIILNKTFYVSILPPVTNINYDAFSFASGIKIVVKHNEWKWIVYRHVDLYQNQLNTDNSTLIATLFLSLCIDLINKTRNTKIK